jgi:hypothetical protein
LPSVNLAITIGFFAGRVHIFEDRNLKLGVCIENAYLHLLFKFSKEILTL